MIEVLKELPDNVVAFVAKGRVTRRDYNDVLIPKVSDALDHHEKIRCYYELGPEFLGMDLGAAWEDFMVGITTLTRWERVAVVTDVEWVRLAISMFRFLVPGEVRMFGTSEALEARRWIRAANS